MTEQLLITQSYGWGTGDTISLRCHNYNPSPELEEVLLGFSCHRAALPKIRSCLTYSARYDCEVQPSWFRRQAGNLENMLKEIGIELQILRLSPTETIKLDSNFKGVRHG